MEAIMSSKLDELTKKLNIVLNEKGVNSTEYQEILDEIVKLSKEPKNEKRIQPIAAQSNGASSIDRKSLFRKNGDKDEI